MTVNLTRIYTRLGDSGETHLGDMSRVSKNDPRVEAYGTLDELNALIGAARLADGMPRPIDEILARVQNELLDVGADVCVPPGGERERLRIDAAYTERLERECDEFNAPLPPLRSFVIPGGTPSAAALHVCRTVCRRAERRALAVEDSNAEIVRYLNRLSDLFFILARTAGEAAGSEPLWAPGGAESGD